MTFDDNILRFLRMSNVFGAPNPNLDTGQGTFTGQPIRQGPMIDFKPETRASDEFYNLITNPPVRNKPGKLRKIAAGMAGIAGGHEASQDFLYRPYHESIQDWQLKLKPVEAAANQERYYNANMRQLADAQVARQIQQQRADEYTQRTDIMAAQQAERERSGEAKRILDEKKFQLAEFKAKNPNYVFKTREDGQIVGISPQDPTKSVDTGIKSNELSDLEKIELGLDASLTRIGAQAEVAKELEDIRQENRLEVEAERQAGRSALLKERTSLTTGSKGETPTAAKQRILNRARQAINEHPEWTKYITFSRDGVTIKGAGGGLFGYGTRDQKTRDEIYNYIYGQKVPPAETITTLTVVKVRDKRTGQTGQFKGTAKEATEAGYEVIQ